MMVIREVIWQKSSTLWFVALSLGRIRSNTSNFPDARYRSGLMEMRTDRFTSCVCLCLRSWPKEELALTPGLSHQRILNAQKRIPAKTVKIVFIHTVKHFSLIVALFWSSYCPVFYRIAKSVYETVSVRYGETNKWGRNVCLHNTPQWYLYLLEHVRVVTDLPQLHDGVHQCLCASFTLVNTAKQNIQHVITGFYFGLLLFIMGHSRTVINTLFKSRHQYTVFKNN